MAKSKKSWRKCAGVNALTGKIKRGYRVNPEGGCPKLSTKGKSVVKRARSAKACTPMIKKGVKVGFHKGVQACVRALPSDKRAEWNAKAARLNPGADLDPSALGGTSRHRRRRRSR